ncbi:BRO family protein [Enterococcus dongliensis]|uniref:BRO-N domain-containing protein n=1 Tax=Enterococcus dongliensis TaxID=2559925 RepID=UPI0028909344|nr:BRO family protein [Enterococcus dongliensis]MDT2638651.1 BRO family protein [Enterococcus dongliensis]
MKTEIWNGHEIRFVEVNDEWWAVLSDVAKALDLRTDKLNVRLEDDNLSKVPIKDEIGRLQLISIVNEFGIYEAVFSSRKPKAREFKKWVFNVIKELRQSLGVEGFQVFRMLDKEHQKDAMAKLNRSIKNPKQTDFIKANMIANKAISDLYGHPKMVKKGAMTPKMLVDREAILDETVQLMMMKEKYGLHFSVSEKIYSRQEWPEIA